MTENAIKKVLMELPEDLEKEVLDYVDFLKMKYEKQNGKSGFKFDWEGGLADLRTKYTSVELQHKIQEMR